MFIARRPRHSLGTQLLNGLLFGSAAVIGMLSPLTLEPGVIFDGRTAVVTMAALFGGPPTAAVASLMAVAYRLWLGGSGVYMGVATIFTAAGIGLGAWELRRRGWLPLNKANLALLGFVVHLGAFLWIFLLPMPVRANFLHTVALPYLLVLPIVTLLLGLLLKSQEQRADDEQALRDYRARLQEAKRIAALGDWYWDLRSNTHSWPEEILQLCGLDPAMMLAKPARIQDAFTPASWLHLHKRIKQARATGAPFKCDLEITSRGAQCRWITMRGEAVRDHSGQVTKLRGTVQDITEHRRMEAELREREYFFRESQQAAQIGSYKADFTANRWASSDVLDQIFGIDVNYTHSVEGWLNLIHPDDRPHMERYLHQEILIKGCPFNQEYRIVRPKDGQMRWVLGLGEVATDQDGKVVSLTGTIQDITERRNAETQLRLAASVFAHSLEGILITDADNLILDVNPSFTRITGYAKAEVLGCNPSILASRKHDQAFYANLWQHLREQGSWHGEIWNQRKNGEIFAAILSISTVFDANGHLQNYIAVIIDNSENKALEAQLEHIAYHDHLTGVPNRRLLTDRLSRAVARARRNNQLLAVCYLDLDGFKPINDSYGHEVGDHCLVKIADNLRRLLRQEDTVARFGGDEFVLLLTDLARLEDCEELLERILSTIRAPFKLQGRQHRVSASIGVTLYPLDIDDPDTLLRHADQAMYRAKEAGKDCYHLYDPEQDRLLHARRDKLRQITQGLQQGDFILHYQPQVDMISREVTGFEALIRWQHPEQGLLMPGAFLDDIEGSELETTLGEWVIEAALRQLEHWQASQLNVPISVNISAGHLLCSDFATDLQKTLSAHPQVAAGQLKLEILETAAISDFEQARSVLTDCRALGVHLALDDFGTGYSSLAYFRTLPIDVLKIDQSFVRDMLHDAGDMDIVESVVNLSHAFKRAVIAEGVETPAHAAVLTWLGCRFGQGYGFARPMPAEAVIDWYRHWTAQPGWSAEADDSLTSDLALMLKVQNCRYWIHHLQNLLEHPPPDLPGAQSDPRLSRFDQWLSSPERSYCHELNQSPGVADQHQRLRQLVFELLTHLRAGDPAPAQARLPELLHAQEDLLMEVKRVLAPDDILPRRL
nr:EAL domain-containing protein [Rhabdochromatium marinum]